MDSTTIAHYTPRAFTTRELRAMSPQDVFDHCARHLFHQGQQSIGEDKTVECAYRGTEGRMCAIGLFIPTRVYKSSMDTVPLNLWAIRRNSKRYAAATASFSKLLLDLQMVHDALAAWKSTNRMRTALADVAYTHQLNSAILGTASFPNR